jgi:N-ethylmaleimide reductase
MPIYPEMEADYLHLSHALSRMGAVYLHLINHPAMGPGIARAFRGPVMLAGGYAAETGEAALRNGEAEFISMGKPFIGNPDLVERLHGGKSLNPLDFSTFYAGGEKGYIDYPALDRQTACA